MALALVDNHPRPALRLIPGGLAAEPTPAVYRRRRVVALILAVAFVVVAMAGVRAVLPPTGADGGRPLSAAGSSDPVTAGHETLLVQPGETLWDIARDLQPTGDLRPVVDELAALNGGATLEAGQRIALPS
jgi:hypothetical protein